MFSTRIFPVLTPLAVDPGHPFPYISNLSLNLAIRVEDPDTHLIHFARVKIPPLLGRFVSPEPASSCPSRMSSPPISTGSSRRARVLERHVCVTRNADLEVDDDGAEDLLEALEEEIRRRRTSPAVRLELEEGMPPEMRNLLARELQVGPADIYTVPVPSCRAGRAAGPGPSGPQGRAIPGPDSSRLVATDLAEADIFAVLRAGDLLVQHPYDSFGTTVERLIEQAAADPTSSPSSRPSIAHRGRARSWRPWSKRLRRASRSWSWWRSRRASTSWRTSPGPLENAGCHVMYGMLGLKTHSKLCLVVREEEGEIRRYVHVGTGNYNPTTARSTRTSASSPPILRSEPR